MSSPNPGHVLLAEGPVPFTLEGHTFEADGTLISEARIDGAYLGAHGALVSGHGKPLGRYRITSTWRMPRNCWVSSTRSQVVATVNGRNYQGQSFGQGMLFNGRRLVRELQQHSR